MSLYQRDDEARIRLLDAVRDWGRSGLISRDQSTRLAGELTTGLRRTHVWLRLVIAFFTALVVLAAVLLCNTLLAVQGQAAEIVVALIQAAVCAAVAVVLVTRTRLYRFGVEEVLGISAVLLCAAAADDFTRLLMGLNSWHAVQVVWTIAIAAGGAVLYATFGWVYAAIGAAAYFARIPLELSWRAEWSRTASALVLLAFYAFARARHRRDGDDYPGDDAAAIETVAWFGLYAVINLRLANVWFPVDFDGVGSRFGSGAFYWTTYALIWILPIAGLTLAIRERHRWLLRANLVMLFVTTATNKPYLGRVHQSWDPIVLGVIAIVAAMMLRRWLDAGPSSNRFGYTAAQLSATDADLLHAVATLSVAFRPAPDMPASADSSAFQGGRSGGGGATSDF